jgi:hypothetical protein
VNHLKHYIKLMRKAEAWGWTKVSAPCYVEGRHVFPTSIFGKNRRVVFLTAREHFIAHLLLWKACRKRYGVQHWKTAKAGKCVQAMSMKSQFNGNRQTGRLYEIVKKANSESMSGDLHWSRQDGAVCPFVALNKDPVRAKRIGEMNGKREKEKAAKGEHAWQNPETIARLVQQRKDSGVLIENGKKTKGKLWWNNGSEQTRTFECPGEGWARGRLPFPPNTNRSLEATENRRKAQLGKKLSEEHKLAIGAGASNHWRNK